jgi:hypothetical protein
MMAKLVHTTCCAKQSCAKQGCGSHMWKIRRRFIRFPRYPLGWSTAEVFSHAVEAIMAFYLCNAFDLSFFCAHNVLFWGFGFISPDAHALERKTRAEAGLFCKPYFCERATNNGHCYVVFFCSRSCSCNCNTHVTSQPLRNTRVVITILKKNQTLSRVPRPKLPRFLCAHDPRTNIHP